MGAGGEGVLEAMSEKPEGINLREAKRRKCNGKQWGEINLTSSCCGLAEEQLWGS